MKFSAMRCLFILLLILSAHFSAAAFSNKPAAVLLSERSVKVKVTYNVNVSGKVNMIELKLMVPHDVKDRQTVKSLSFSMQPDSVYTKNTNKYVLFRFKDIEKSFKIIVKSDLTIYRKISDKNDSTAKDLTPYLIAEKNIESDSSRIVALAATLKQKSDIETIMKTFEYVQTNIKYEANEAIGAEKVLQTKVGKCMDYSDLFVALLRANKIPAKSVFGMLVDFTGENPLHAWPEAYLEKQGWVRFDPTTGHSDITKSAGNYTMKISNKYIVLSEGRNDVEMPGNVMRWRYRVAPGGTLNIKESFDVSAQETEDSF